MRTPLRNSGILETNSKPGKSCSKPEEKEKIEQKRKAAKESRDI